MTNCFELHIGLPDDAASVNAGRKLLAVLRDQHSDWTCSDVFAVSAKGCIDPHNVPGTLRLLISREGPVISREVPVWDQLTTVGSSVEAEVRGEAQRALDLMTTADFRDARLEIEYPYGCFHVTVDGNKVIRNAVLGDPVTIEDSNLRFRNATAVLNTPNWEIHFVVEKFTSAPATHSMESVAGDIESYGVNVEQTIAYRSQSMKDRGSEDNKFISTAYYDTADDVEKAARHLFYRTDLCERFAKAGYSVKLVLEHIVGCFQPLVKDSRPQADMVAPENIHA